MSGAIKIIYCDDHGKAWCEECGLTVRLHPRLGRIRRLSEHGPHGWKDGR